MRHMQSTRKWAASALKIPKWASISSTIQTITGSKLSRTPNVKSPWNFSKGIQILFFLFLQLCQSFLNLC